MKSETDQANERIQRQRFIANPPYALLMIAAYDGQGNPIRRIRIEINDDFTAAEESRVRSNWRAKHGRLRDELSIVRRKVFHVKQC